jgi:hypothetical protein
MKRLNLYNPSCNVAMWLNLVFHSTHITMWHSCKNLVILQNSSICHFAMNSITSQSYVHRDDVAMYCCVTLMQKPSYVSINVLLHDVHAYTFLCYITLSFVTFQLMFFCVTSMQKPCYVTKLLHLSHWNKLCNVSILHT